MKHSYLRAFSMTLAVAACLTAMAALSGCGSGSGDRQLTPVGPVNSN